jgi:hypothetical protein
MSMKIPKKISSVATLASFAALVTGCGVNTAQQVSGEDAVAAVPAEAAGANVREFKVGDFVRLGDFTIKVNKVSNPYKSHDSWSQPKKGNKYVAVSVSVKNSGSEPQTVSSLICFDLRDSEGQAAKIAMLTDAPSSPDGEIAPGKFIKGTLGFELPKNAKGLTLEFKCDPFTSGTATVSLD